MEALQVDGVRATRARYPNMPQGIEARTATRQVVKHGPFRAHHFHGRNHGISNGMQSIRIIIRYIMMYCSNNGMCQQLKYWWDVLLADM